MMTEFKNEFSWREGISTREKLWEMVRVVDREMKRKNEREITPK